LICFKENKNLDLKDSTDKLVALKNQVGKNAQRNFYIKDQERYFTCKFDKLKQALRSNDKDLELML
jgi:hypothetical protein